MRSFAPGVAGWHVLLPFYSNASFAFDCITSLTRLHLQEPSPKRNLGEAPEAVTSLPPERINSCLMKETCKNPFRTSIGSIRHASDALESHQVDRETLLVARESLFEISCFTIENKIYRDLPPNDPAQMEAVLFSAVPLIPLFLLFLYRFLLLGGL